MKDIKIFIRKIKIKSDNMVMNLTKISHKIKNKNLLSIEKNIAKSEKLVYHDYEEYKDAFKN